jgi:hypothetical protein
MHAIVCFSRSRRNADNHSKRTKAKGRALMNIMLTALLASSFAFGQADPAPVLRKGTASRPPLKYLYVDLLLYQSHLDKAAASREAQGKEGAWLRNHLQDRLGFTGSQMSVVRAAGLRLEFELNELRSRMKAVIDADRAAHPKDPNLTLVAPSPPAILKDLAQEQEDLIQREVDKLNHDLGPEASATLRSYIETSFIQNGDSSSYSDSSQPSAHPQPHEQQPFRDVVQP